MAKLIYIGGYGRSGSTLLEYLLTMHPAIVGCGEIERHLLRFGKRKICTCGERAKRCPVWGAFQHKSGKLRGWDHQQLTLALLEHVSADYDIMVDSSKTAWGSVLVPFRLSRKLGHDFLLVHLVRDPRGVCWSAMKTPARPRKAPRSSGPAAIKALRAAVGWTVANLACEIFGWLHPQNYLRVRYEDLANAPDRVIGGILKRMSLPSPAKIEWTRAADNRHQLYGNAMRFKALAPEDLKEDVAWKSAMPRGYRRLVFGLCWPLSKRYAYGRPTRPAAPEAA